MSNKNIIAEKVNNSKAISWYSYDIDRESLIIQYKKSEHYYLTKNVSFELFEKIFKSGESIGSTLAQNKKYLNKSKKISGQDLIPYLL